MKKTKPTPKTRIKSPAKFSRRLAIYMVVIFGAIGGYAIYQSFAASNPLNNYYPNPSRYQAGYYLEGLNYEGPNAPARSVLWFKNLGSGSFRQYNSAPYETCHWDQLQWNNGYLKYTQTSDKCGSNNNQVILDPIIFMPANWSDGTKWSNNGTANETHYDHGKVVCKGTNKWGSKVIGWEQVNGVNAIHTQTNEFTTWTSGSGQYGCVVGQTQWWQENFWMTPTLGIIGTKNVDGGLIRSQGGNANNYQKTGHWDWDVRMTGWQKLP